MAGDQKQTDGIALSTVTATEGEAATGSVRREPLAPNKNSRHVELRPSGTLFSPNASLVLVVGFVALCACIAPWLTRGWMWFGLTCAVLALLVSYDAIALWLARKEFSPVLLDAEKGLRGREGQTIQIPLALASRAKHLHRREVRAGLMPATEESEIALRVAAEPQRLKLEQSSIGEEGRLSTTRPQMQLWAWQPEITLLRRGLWPGPRVGVEQFSRLQLWRLRQWFDVPESLRIDADLRPGRHEILRSPIYRALVAAQQTPWTGHGREFERLREYQPGDNFAEIAWKSTARRATPVTRMFQWEQKQEVYFVVDQSRVSALALDPNEDFEIDADPGRAPRRMLDIAVETALVGATVALELGDEFGLVTYADEPKTWLRAGSGRFQFHQVRERLLNIQPLPTTADYEALFAEIRLRLRRRAYLLVLADVAERTASDSLRRGVSLVRSSHALLMTSILPAHAQPAFSSVEDLQTDQDVYAALAGEKENQRLGALARQMSQLDVKLRYVPPEKFLRTAVEGYLESKREQRL